MVRSHVSNFAQRRLIRRGRGLVRTVFLVAVLNVQALATTIAAAPKVDFDVATSVACKDVTTPEFATAFPSEKLLQATFNISSLVRSGREKDLTEFFYRIEGQEGALRIVDHLPRQELASPFAGPIAVEKKDEATKKVGGLITGHYPPFSNAELNAQAGSTSGLSVRYELLPPKELLAASGTLNRERGVYFKLRPSAQTSLEGAKQFVCVLRVPKAWRGDCVRVDCQATAGPVSTWPIFDESSPCGAASFLIGLFVAGDEEARQAVAEVVTAEERLTGAVRQHQPQLIALWHRSRVPGYAELRRLVNPLPVTKLKSRLLDDQAQGRLPRELPSELKAAVEAVPTARRLAKGFAASP